MDGGGIVQADPGWPEPTLRQRMQDMGAVGGGAATDVVAHVEQKDALIGGLDGIQCGVDGGKDGLKLASHLPHLAGDLLGALLGESDVIFRHYQGGGSHLGDVGVRKT